MPIRLLRALPLATAGILVVLAAPARAETCTLTGTSGRDILTGTNGADVICGLGGDDVINGNGGDDVLLGDAGNDNLKGAAGADRLDGGAGNDASDGGTEGDVLAGGEGLDDRVSYASRTRAVVVTLDDLLANDGEAGEGDDMRSDVERVDGGVSDDRIAGSGAGNVFNGGRGDDVLEGAAGERFVGRRGGRGRVLGWRGCGFGELRESVGCGHGDAWSGRG